MTVQELCEKLFEIGQTRMINVLEDKSVISNTEFPEALTTDWLADNIQTVFETTTREQASQAELIGQLEINAFLAAFQKMYENSRKTRVNRWAAVMTSQNKDLADDGPLKAQLNHIGVKVEDEWLVDTVPMRAET